ncbi:DUF4105 domain-containing protein [Xanthomarina sp. F2636L]|uniref:lipoprotein N-acyltransferase Lnb domain-containing protein n=1 Tax=Xanthomarina sp. F2636L TaxID=2996018 RepID=UPI00225E16A8|nr:DUF4105 domain-containing protein [Xanthomarina sp. F2636L]MCX7549388.1 DUF4105 domain-containing protein [Xanthomarina sp. F2636L]
MQKIVLAFSACLFVVLSSFSQTRRLSPDAEISVLTIGPGTSLNDAFGHSGFRIKDRRFGIDDVYNYGIYDFNTPNFYLKFAQGKLHYLIGKNPYEDFYNAYVYQNRTIEEQTLNLTQIEKQQLYDYLLNNIKPENRAYLYDFFYDNCATRIKDVLVKNSNSEVVFNIPKDFKPQTFRRLIREKVPTNSWGGVGIDLALGSVIDRPATPEEHMFLPEYIHTFFGEATLANSNQSLVQQNRVVFEKREMPVSNQFLFSPYVIFSILGLIIVSITYLDYKNQRRTRLLDILIFSITGLIGVLILLLWFATDHDATAQNYNLLWAFVLNLFVIGQLIKPTPKLWFIKYLKFLVIMLCLMSFHWLVGIQVFATALLPLLLALGLRYVFLIWYYSR